MNGKTIKKKLCPRKSLRVQVPLNQIFEKIPPMPEKPPGWEDNLFVDGWRRTRLLCETERGFLYETEIVSLWKEDGGIGHGESRIGFHHDPYVLPNEWEVRDLPPELLDLYKARITWENTALKQKEPILKALFEVSLKIGGTFKVVGGLLLFFFFLPPARKDKLFLASALHKVFRIAKHQHVHMKISTC